MQSRIRLYRAQAEFRASQKPFRGFVGGRGSGKSYVGAYDLLRRAERGRLYAIYAPTYPVLRDTALRSFLGIARDLSYLRDFNKSDGLITLGNGSEIIARSLDDPEHARGPNLSGAWMEEASLVDRMGFDLVIASLREGGRQGWLSCTFTPKGRGHWTYDVFGRGDNPHAAIFHASTRDNPFLPSTFADTISAQYTTQFAAQEVEGSFIESGGKMAKREWFRVVDAIPTGAKMVRAWDFAATAKESADFTVGTLMCQHEKRWTVCDVVRQQIAGGEIERLVRRIADQDGKGVNIVLEREPGSSGIIASASIIRALAGYTIRAVPVTGDKAQRAMPLFAQAEAGNVAILRAPWNRDWLAEIEDFPPERAGHDDQVDSAALAFSQLVNSAVAMPVSFASAPGTFGM